MMLALTFIGALSIVLLPNLLGRYLRALPDAPLCPGCRALTHECDDQCLVALVLPALAATVIRECMACGWRGRMRLRLAPEGARGA